MCRPPIFLTQPLPEEHAELFLWQKLPKREADHSSPCRSDAVRCLRHIVAGLLPVRPGLGPGQVLVKFISYNVALERGLLRIVRLFVFSVIAPCGL
jgi:hypothetical protein